MGVGVRGDGFGEGLGEWGVGLGWWWWEERGRDGFIPYFFLIYFLIRYLH